MEFEVLQEALVEVMNVAPNEIHMDTTLAEKDRKGGNCQAGSKAA